MKKNKKIRIAFLLVTYSFGVYAESNTSIGRYSPPTSTGAVIITGTIGMSTGAVASADSQKATIKAIQKGGEHVDKQINKSWSANIQSLSENSGALRALLTQSFDALNASFAHDIKRFAVSQEKSSARYTYGEQGRTAELCDSTELPEQAMDGKRAVAGLMNTNNVALNAWSQYSQTWSDGAGSPTIKGQGSHAIVRYLKKAITTSDISNDVVNPVNLTLTDEAAIKTKNINRMILNPFPSEKLHTDIEQTEEGKRYLIAKDIERANRLLPESVKSIALSDKMRSHEMSEWAKDVWEDMDQKGEPNGLVKGKLSKNALLDLLVSARFQNQNWQAKADGRPYMKAGKKVSNGANNAWLERELLSSQAIMLEIEWQRLKDTKKLVSLMAEKRNQKLISESKGALDRLNAGAIK